MNNLERSIFKVLTGNMSKADFEKDLYQPCYIDKIAEDDFIAELIAINYNDRDWKSLLQKIILKIYSEEEFLAHLIKLYCLGILSQDDIESTINILYSLSDYNYQYYYEYDTLIRFNSFYEEYGYIKEGYGLNSEKEFLKEVKSFARFYLDKFENEQQKHQLLFLSLNREKYHSTEMQNISSNDLVEYAKNRILNIESKKNTLKYIGAFVYDKNLIDHIYSEARNKAFQHLFPLGLTYLTVGIPLLIAGILGVSSQKEISYVYILILLGSGLTLTGLYYVAQISYLLIRKQKTSKKN
ncbi:hypothetical protein EV197_0701 [Aquimarina brevivitae]|uniref:Uncharacterized protein n=2 Tax=Aquimarina brevivitae TaxID=323412 RepID=A0A4Q7PKJ9_9FLAO|nr:hypothetical protein EV197_0701 [Aquimarina brevivitae]